MFLLHADTILDPDSHASESGRPPIRVRDVDPAENAKASVQPRAVEYTTFETLTVQRSRIDQPATGACAIGPAYRERRDRCSGLGDGGRVFRVPKQTHTSLALDVLLIVTVQMIEECTYVARHIETEPRQAILERCFCDLVDLVEGVRGVGAAEGYAGSLGGEDGVVEVFLGSGEGA